MSDVVIPLMLRALYPAGILLYPIGHVGVAEGETARFAYRRRKRLSTGNLQWITALITVLFQA